ncbi:MAG: hypothetical protein JXX14_23400 [Deltaproteobacteria bacterium]|nr:hypothetical protein [Deltaproteobacteria bacterium]
MNYALYEFPPETSELVQLLKQQDWIVHAFKTDKVEDFFTPADLAYNVDYNGVEYELILDTNIYQFLLNSQKKPPTEFSRAAVALLAFCQLTSIEIDPVFAVYEKISYQKERAPQQVDDLLLFYQIDRTCDPNLAKYAFGEVENYQAGTPVERDRNALISGLTQYRRLKEWDSMYLNVLACIHYYLRKDLTNNQKIEHFYLWMVKSFRRSLVCLVFGSVLFSSSPLKKMMKYRTSSSPAQKKQQVVNMAWDLYIMNMFFRKSISRESHIEFAYATADKAFRELLQLSIDVQIAGGPSPLKNVLNKSDYEHICRVWEIDAREEERVYESAKWTSEYRAELILEFESGIIGGA